jgi:hypothetical protein
MRWCLKQHLVVRCEVELIELEIEGDDGREHKVESLCVRCGECGKEVEVYGTSDRSVRWAFARFREDCGDSLGGHYYQAE